MSNQTAAATTECPECGAQIAFQRPPLAGEVRACPGCAAEFEVVALNPIRVELAPEVEEDWGE